MKLSLHKLHILILKVIALSALCATHFVQKLNKAIAMVFSYVTRIIRTTRLKFFRVILHVPINYEPQSSP